MSKLCGQCGMCSIGNEEHVVVCTCCRADNKRKARAAQHAACDRLVAASAIVSAKRRVLREDREHYDRCAELVVAATLEVNKETAVE